MASLPHAKSDHFDGTVFFNPEGARRRVGRFPFLRWIAGRESRARWPAHVENRIFVPPSGDVAEGEVSLSFIGHATFLLRLPGLCLITDPMFSGRCSPVQWAGPSRVRAPGLPMEVLPKPDAILLSHNHYDHCDLPSLRRLQSRFGRVPIIAPLGNRAWLAKQDVHNVIELDWWQHFDLHGAKVTLTPARHFSARTLRDRNTTLWGGFLLHQHGAKIYFAGDTGYTGFFRTIRERLGAPDVALLPIGAYEPRWFMGDVHMNPADAVHAMRDLHAGQAVGMHFGTFQLTDEPIDAPLIDLAVARAAAGLEEARFCTLDFGETRSFTIGAG